MPILENNRNHHRWPGCIDDSADLTHSLTQAAPHNAAEQARGYVRHYRDQLGAVQ